MGWLERETKAWETCLIQEPCLPTSKIILAPFFPVHMHLPSDEWGLWLYSFLLIVPVHSLIFLALWRLKDRGWFLKWHGPSEPFQWAQWLKISSAFGPCVSESSSDWPLQRGHTTFPEPTSFLFSLQLTLHPLCLLPHQFPQSFFIYHSTGGLGSVTQMFSPSN